LAVIAGEKYLIKNLIAKIKVAIRALHILI
jgi:hypothetical protein